MNAAGSFPAIGRTVKHSAASRIENALVKLAAAGVVGTLLFLVPSTAVWAASPHVQSTSSTSRCQQCHALHISDPIVVADSAISSDKLSRTCVACHDGRDAGASNIATGLANSFQLSSGHSLTAPSPGGVTLGGCAACHDPHAIPATARMLPAQNVNGVAMVSAGKGLCVACHDAADSWYGPGYPSTAAPVRDTAGYPVSGTWTGPDTYASVGSAHRLIPEATQTPAASDPVKREQGDCLYCHASHRGPNAYDGLVATFTVPTPATLVADTASGAFAALCFECHSGVLPSGFSTAPANIKRFATDPATAPTSSAGHRVITAGGTLPVGAPLPCFECHNPHGSKRGNSSLLSDERGASLSTTNSADVRRFCFTCHTTADSISGWDSQLGAYTTDSAARPVVGLARSGGVLHLPAINGHKEGDIASCYDCHGNGYAPGDHNVHDPGKGDAGYVITAPMAALTSSNSAPPITMAEMLHLVSGGVSPVVADPLSGGAATPHGVGASGQTTEAVVGTSTSQPQGVTTPTVSGPPR